MSEHILQASGILAGAMSTVAFKVSGREVDNVSGQTTTEAPEVQAWLGRMVDAGAQCVVIETTSHALVQERVRACEFDVAAFTNVGRDHLDYHATWEDYLEAKARLIDLTANAADKGVEKTAVLNRDDPSYERLARRPISRRWSYSLKTGADFHPLDLSITGSGSRFRMKTPVGETEVTLNVPAKFNIYNALCAAAVCVALGVPVDEIGRGLAGFEGVRGRLEPVDLGQDFRVYIDFAHAAGSLASALAELRPFTQGRLIVVFGSTARSDHDRPGMGRAAAEFSDFFIITTDDPLSEDPVEIARDVQAGASSKAPGLDYEVVIDRRAAIRRAIEIARPGDTVLLAGKGHERSMRTSRGSEPWDGRGRDWRGGLARHPLPVGERDLGRGARTAAYHAHDLDSVPIAECDARERSARDDLAVVLHRDRARVDAQPLEVVEQGGWLIELYLLAVHLQGDHSKSLMAA